MSDDTISIEPIGEQHIEGFRRTVDVVARERHYLAGVEGFSPDATREFVAGILNGGGVSFVALQERNVVGWCDVVRRPFEGFQHTGTLGMGLLSEYRGQGIGQRLLESAVAAAAAHGLARIELEVYASNTVAIKLYERFGFVTEGLKRAARILDGQTDDLVCMAYFPQPQEQQKGDPT